MNAIAPLVFLLAAFVLVSFAIRCVAWLVGRRRDRAVRRPHWTSVLASVLAAAVLAVQLAAVHVERARYRAAEDAVASSATRSDIETRLGLPRELTGEQVFLDGPVLSTNLVLKDEWRYNFDSPLSPFAFSHDLVIGFRPDDTIDYAYWARFGLPPSAIPFAQSPATPSPADEPHAESAENAEPEPHADPRRAGSEIQPLQPLQPFQPNEPRLQRAAKPRHPAAAGVAGWTPRRAASGAPC